MASRPRCRTCGTSRRHDARPPYVTEAVEAAEAGRRLAQRHQAAPVDTLEGSVLDYAERARADDWSMRSALVRFAQPEPVRAGAVLELVRRVDGALHPLVRSLERTAVVCDRLLDESVRPEPREPYPDARVVDLARLVAAMPHAGDAVVDAYDAVVSLTDDERAALPLLGPALALDALAEILADWAVHAPGDPPVEPVDATNRRVFEHLEALGVPRETGPPPRGRRSGV